MTVEDMTWVWADEVIDLVERRMRAERISAGELARRAGERFGVNPESFERQWREAQDATGVMRVHRADALLVLVGRHLTDLPCYCAAMRGELAPDQWPVRGRVRPGRHDRAGRSAKGTRERAIDAHDAGRARAAGAAG